MKELFLPSTANYNSKGNLKDEKKGSLTTSTILLTLNLNLYEKNVMQR